VMFCARDRPLASMGEGGPGWPVTEDMKWLHAEYRQRLGRSFLQHSEEQDQRRAVQENESNIRTKSSNQDKQFSIESLLGKDDRGDPHQSDMFTQNPSSHYLPGSSQVKSFYRQMTEMEDMRPEGGRRMKNKRVRTIFTPEQLERMEDEFNKTQYMVGHDRVLLATRLNLTEAQVKVWFQNRRIKWRKQNQHSNQYKLEILRSKQQQSTSDPGMLFVKQEEDGDDEDLLSGHVHTLHQEQHHHPHHMQHPY